jgi:hypothetical protein
MGLVLIINVVMCAVALAGIVGGLAWAIWSSRAMRPVG